MAITTCTLTIKDDYRGEYEDDFLHRREDGKHVEGPLGTSRLTRDVVRLLHRWVANFPQCRRDELMVLGRALYEIAFGTETPDRPRAPLKSAFEDTLRYSREANRRLRLRLVLSAEAQQLAAYPWEFLYMDGGANAGFFLAGEDTNLTLTRYVPNSDTWERAPEDDDGRLRILVVVSTPRIPEMTDLMVGDFVKHLIELDPTRFQTLLVESPTKMELSATIKHQQPHVIHFIGHGRAGALALRKDAATLAADREYFEDQSALGKRPPPVSEAAWLDAYTASGVLRSGLERRDAPQRLIFLHACEGATQEQNRMLLGTFSDVARTLVSGERITGVIAMQYTIGVDEAEFFAKSFYGAISEGLRVDDAVRAARAEFAQTPLRGRQQSWDSRGFGTPVIYLRREEALISRPARQQLPDTAIPVHGVTAGIPVTTTQKEPCPNPICANGWVLRTSSPPTCRRCQEPFSVCPQCSGGLVVPKPRYQCRDCDYVFSAPTPAVLAGGPLSGRTRTVESPGSPREGSPGQPIPSATSSNFLRTASKEPASALAEAGDQPSTSADDRVTQEAGAIGRDELTASSRILWPDLGVRGNADDNRN